MADQNQNLQNQIPGTLRTFKTDLEIANSNPQDRLQQAGNFVQARPESFSNINPNTTVTAVSNNPINTKPIVEKKDIPATSTEPKVQPNYSWSNMSSVADINSNDSFNSTKQSPSETKSGFSVLDESIDLPLDNNFSTKSKAPNPVSNPTNFNLNPETTPNLATNNNNQFDINSLNLQDDITNSKPKKSSVKNLIPFIVVILLLVLISGGVYFYFNISNTSNTTVTNNTDTNLDTDNTDDASIDTDNTTSTSSFNSPLKASSILDVSFNDSEPIRRTITTLLADKSDTLIQLNLTKDSTTVSLIDISDVLGLTIPSIGTIENYALYAYNQQGVYKLVAVLGLPLEQDAKTFIDNWSNSIPRNLTGFSINLPSRIVNEPQIKKSTITNSAGNVFENYYYNYTSPSDSIDVSSYENFVLMASSQDSMRYILEQIR
jgi:hypothetical protein